MGNSISSTYSSLDALLASTTSLKNQVGVLQEQTSTGKLSQDYAGLGTATSQVLDLQAATAQSAGYAQTITTAQGKASAMQDVLTQIQSVVSSVSSAALGLTGTASATTVSSVSLQAKQALTQVASLLNTQYDGQYLFSGADSSNPPIPSAQNITSSGLYTQIGAALNALASNPTTPAIGTVIANTVAVASSTAPGTTVFSNYLTNAGRTATQSEVQVSPTQQISLDLPANQNVGAASDPSGTGSAISDILRGLAVVANSSTAISGNPDFATLMQNASATLTSAGQTVAAESGALGLTQNTLTAASSQNSSTQTAMQTQLSNLTDVDMATAISQLQAVSTQLQASYNVISTARNLTLANYLQ